MLNVQWWAGGASRCCPVGTRVSRVCVCWRMCESMHGSHWESSTVSRAVHCPILGRHVRSLARDPSFIIITAPNFVPSCPLRVYMMQRESDVCWVWLAIIVFLKCMISCIKIPRAFSVACWEGQRCCNTQLS